MASQPEPLKPDAERGRPLHVGEAIRCDPGGRIRLWLYGKEIAPEECQTWYPVPQVPIAPHPALKAYGELGGRRRGSGGGLMFPFDSSVVRARGSLVIRWRAGSGIKK